MHPALVKIAAKDSPDFEIAQRIAAGDREELRRLMRRYNQRLYRTARSILKDDAEAEDVWNENTLDRFLASPPAVVPGTAMGYAGIADRKERADLIAYLKQANQSPQCGK